MRLVQIRHRSGERAVAIVDADVVRPLENVDSVHALAIQADEAGDNLATSAANRVSGKHLPYDEVYDGHSEWRLLPAVDHPADASRCLVSGTGLTHVKSAQNRQAMHAADAAPTDSMRMYQWGVEGGRPAPGTAGIAPEWFYKGPGTILRAHGEPLVAPWFGEDCGEEPELAGIYFVDRSGAPRRIGMAIGNEFSDHGFEKRNYLYLAGSKLMPCAIGPELNVTPDFAEVTGDVSVERGGAVLWSRAIRTGDAAMSHSLANMEHHHFKFPAHRRPGDVHVHFFGADAFSFGEGVTLRDGDVMQVRFAGFGRPLRNPVAIETGPDANFAATPL